MNKKPIRFVLLLPLLFLCSCATLPGRYPRVSELKAYAVDQDKSPATRFSPVFLIENPEERYNRIGMPVACLTEDGKEAIYMNDEIPTIYSEKRSFVTPRGSYTNLIYRIHFEKHCCPVIVN